MFRQLVLLVVSLVALVDSEPAPPLHVVALLVSPERAHRTWPDPLVQELRRRGHVVDGLIMHPNQESDGDPSRPRRIHVLQERLTWSFRNLSGAQRLRDELALGRELSEALLQSGDLASALAEWRSADVLLMDYWLTDAALAFVWEKLGRPACVVLSPQASTPPWVHRLVSGPRSPPYLEATSLLGRVTELAQLLLGDFKYHWQHLPAERRLLSNKLQGTVLDPQVTLVLANELKALSPNRPQNFRVQDVGAMGRPTKSSPTEELVAGSILVEIDARADRILDTVAESFRNFPNPVVVFSDRLKNGSGSVIWSNDPSCRSVCLLGGAGAGAHGARLAVWVGHVPLAHSAVLAGIPQVAVPLSPDEVDLATKLATAGVAVVLDAADVTAEKLKDAVLRASSCQRLRAAASDLAAAAEPVPLPLERARRAVEMAPRLARLLAGRPLGHGHGHTSLLGAMQVDALLALALVAGLALAAASALCALLATLLCYRKKYATKPKSS